MSAERPCWKKIKDVGVDWKKTKPPEEEQRSQFEDTFSPSSQVPSLLGTLVLKDGTEYMIGVGNSQTRFGAYAKYLADFFANEQKMKQILGEDEARLNTFFTKNND